MFPTTGRTHIISSLLTGMLATECLGGGKRKKKKTDVDTGLVTFLRHYLHWKILHDTDKKKP